jgi:hypothetical protein
VDQEVQYPTIMSVHHPIHSDLPRMKRYTTLPSRIFRHSLISVWVCLAALSLLDSLDIVDKNTLAGWLSERQLPSGGLNGRPEKLEDVCYSWWDLASLSILGKLGWINRDKLIGFILESQVCSLLSSTVPLLPVRLDYT